MKDVRESLPQTLLAAIRCEAEGLAVRLVPEEQGGVGWDPAGTYRSLSDTMATLVTA